MHNRRNAGLSRVEMVVGLVILCVLILFLIAEVLDVRASGTD